MKPKKKRDLRRYRASRSRTNYGKLDRSRNHGIDAEDQPIRERMRGPVWRGNNGHGDDTSFGNWNSGNIDDMILHRIVRRFNKQPYVKLVAWVAENLKDRDRAVMEDFLVREFFDHARLLSHRNLIEYEITDAGLVRWNRQKRRWRRPIPEQLRLVVPIDDVGCYVAHWLDQKWYRCELAGSEKFKHTAFDIVTGYAYGTDALGNKCRVYQASYLAGYEVKEPDHLYPKQIVVGDARYSKLFVLRKHSVTGEDVKKIDAYLKQNPLK